MVIQYKHLHQQQEYRVLQLEQDKMVQELVQQQIRLTVYLQHRVQLKQAHSQQVYHLMVLVYQDQQQVLLDHHYNMMQAHIQLMVQQDQSVDGIYQSVQLIIKYTQLYQLIQHTIQLVSLLLHSSRGSLIQETYKIELIV